MQLSRAGQVDAAQTLDVEKKIAAALVGRNKALTTQLRPMGIMIIMMIIMIIITSLGITSLGNTSLGSIPLGIISLGIITL